MQVLVCRWVACGVEVGPTVAFFEFSTDNLINFNSFRRSPIGHSHISFFRVRSRPPWQVHRQQFNVAEDVCEHDDQKHIGVHRHAWWSDVCCNFVNRVGCANGARVCGASAAGHNRI